MRVPAKGGNGPVPGTIAAVAVACGRGTGIDVAALLLTPALPDGADPGDADEVDLAGDLDLYALFVPLADVTRSDAGGGRPGLGQRAPDEAPDEED